MCSAIQELANRAAGRQTASHHCSFLMLAGSSLLLNQSLHRRFSISMMSPLWSTYTKRIHRPAGETERLGYTNSSSFSTRAICVIPRGEGEELNRWARYRFRIDEVNAVIKQSPKALEPSSRRSLICACRGCPPNTRNS